MLEIGHGCWKMIMVTGICVWYLDGIDSIFVGGWRLRYWDEIFELYLYSSNNWEYRNLYKCFF